MYSNAPLGVCTLWIQRLSIKILGMCSAYAAWHMFTPCAIQKALEYTSGGMYVASLAFTAPTALAALALAVALLCVASGNLHGDPSVGSDVANVPDLFSAATIPPRFLALCALAEADAATASSGAPLEERACRRPLTDSIVR